MWLESYSAEQNAFERPTELWNYFSREKFRLSGYHDIYKAVLHHADTSEICSFNPFFMKTLKKQTQHSYTPSKDL